MFDKPFNRMTKSELTEELAYWNENKVDEEWWHDMVLTINNEFKILANIAESKSLQGIQIKRIEGEQDEKGTALVGLLGIIMFVLYMLTTAVVLN